MQEQTNEHDVAIEFWVERKHPLGKTQELQRVLKQSANPRVVHTHRRRCLTHSCHERFVGEVRIRERAHGWMCQGAHDATQFQFHGRNVMLRCRQKPRQIFNIHLNGAD
jgi:hypothetical protein